MPERRRNKRYPKRLKVDYGEKDFSGSGYTHNVSKTGAFIISSKVINPGTHVHLKLYSESDRWVALEGEVRWTKVVPPALRQVQAGGFGARFLLPQELIETLLPQLKTERRFEISYEALEELQAAFKQELKFGGVFVRTEVKIPLHAPAVIEFQLSFIQKVIEIPATVLQVMAGETSGVALTFSDKAAALKALSEHLPKP